MADLVLHGNTPLPLALATPMSAVQDFFSSEPFSQYRKGLEGKAKLVNANFARMDAIIKGMSRLGKLLATKPRGR